LYLGKGQLVAVEGRIQTRQWEDDKKLRHWKTEVVANSVEMLSGRRKKDYATESAADALAAQADAMGLEPVDEAGYAASAAAVSADTDDELEDAELEAAAA
jgi:single-strand DNA-binding protein